MSAVREPASALRSMLVVLLVVAAVTVHGIAPAGASASSHVRGDPTVRYRPPVDAPITDPFRPPAQDWEPGNRGIEYATVPGSSVAAIGPGRVTFAGPVAGRLHVTVTHVDGLRSSYSYLAAIRVAVGDEVRGGDTVGIAGDTFHVGVRRDETYLDPASLWGTEVGTVSVVLVPMDGLGHRSTNPGNPSRIESESTRQAPLTRHTATAAVKATIRDLSSWGA